MRKTKKLGFVSYIINQDYSKWIRDLKIKNKTLGNIHINKSLRNYYFLNNLILKPLDGAVQDKHGRREAACGSVRVQGEQVRAGGQAQGVRVR